ncbi:MAG: hypothetical protein M9962_12505 [Oligoflexia bacterium]|nr:hypothetical protein [Oligoflexia bacterium]
MNQINDNKTAGQKLRELFWEKKNTRKISPELIEIFKKHKKREKKVARPFRPETRI